MEHVPRDVLGLRDLYGTLGLFLALMFLFIRFLPVISITEMRELVHETQRGAGAARRAVPPPGETAP